MNRVHNEKPNFSLSNLFQLPQLNIKKGLLSNIFSGYSLAAVAKSTAGRWNPDNTKATPDAASVFFIVAISVHLHSAAMIRTESMVALVGQLSGWPVSFVSGIPTPISVTTPYERWNSGGDMFCHTKEATAMVATPHHYYPLFTYLFLGLRHADLRAIPCRIQITASSEQFARRILAKDFVLAFAGRVPALHQETRP